MGGGSQTTSQQATIPAWAEGAAQNLISRAEGVSRIPYAPYYGPDVAALTPTQIAAMQGTNQMASAFGMPTADPLAGMPTSQNYGGMQAYSSGGIYDQAVEELKARQPDTYNAIMAQFDPRAAASMGGRPMMGGATPVSYGGMATPLRTEGGGGNREYGGGRAPTGNVGGYTSARDMVDGGGPGKSGTTFGGALGGVSNAAGLSPVGSRDASKGGGGGGMGGGKG